MFISVGVVIIDDIILPDGRSHMAQLGGGGVHAVMGMRAWSESVGLLAPVGEDFPPALRQQLAGRFDLSGIVVRAGHRTPRAWQIFETDGTRHEIFRTDPAEMVAMMLRPEEFPQKFRQLNGVHLHCAPQEVPLWAPFLRQCGDPVILWEPWDPFCAPEHRAEFRQFAPLVDVVSPNLLEARTLTGLQEPDAVADAMLADGARLAVIRMGERGSLLAAADGRRVCLPAYAAGPIVDVTGAGNAYCGGLIVGLARGGDLALAGSMATVSASLALEQFGAVYPVEDVLERSARRLDDYQHTARGQ